MKNSKSLVYGLGLALALFASASAKTGQDWAGWVENYYQQPDAGKLVPAVFALSRDGYFEQAGQPATAIGFLSAVFAQHPGQVAGWMQDFRQLPAAHRRLTVAALWYSGLPGSERELRAVARDSSPELRAEIEQLLAQGPAPVRTTPVQSEASLNLQWGAFLASGDQQHIVNALAALGSGEAGLSTAARLSLAQKAAGHPRVYQICEAQLASQPAGVREQLRTALASVKP